MPQSGGIVGGGYGNAGGLAKLWTPTIENILVNGNASVATGTISVPYASYVGGGDAVHFQMSFSYVPSTGVNTQSLFFDFTLPDGIGDIIDFYGSVKYDLIVISSNLAVYGVRSGGALFLASSNSVVPYTRGMATTYFAVGEQTAFRKDGAVRGIFIL